MVEKMKITYSDMSLPDETDYERSIFLAGPTPRKADVKSWRPEAIELLKKIGFMETVFVPERRDWTASFDYTNQIDWEYEAMTNCSAILFWVPRHYPDMKALTTNVEFGLFIKNPKSTYGRPDDAEDCKYLDWCYRKYRDKKPCNTLKDTVRCAVRNYEDYTIFL